jgi:phage tail sheath protein FI
MDDNQDRMIHPAAPTVVGFVGPAHDGPVDRPCAVRSVDEFVAVFSEGLRLSGPSWTTPFLLHAVHAFFAEGGTRAYVVRTQDKNGRSTPDAYAAALETLEKQHDIAIVAAPGSSHIGPDEQADRLSAAAVADALIRHAERMRYRFAVIDSMNGLDAQGVIAQRARFTSSYAALVYPWIHASDRFSGCDILLPPSGFVAGVYARVDAARGAWTAPANEVVRSAVGLERILNTVEQKSVEQAGVDDIRSVVDRGIVLWGARTTSDDPEWRYVNIRRYAIFLEHSISDGLQWAVFEPNGEALWSTVRCVVGAFLDTQWRTGALAGSRPADAYFVRCDQSTMTQDDLNEGRLNCVIGVALQRPAEFVIIRIGVWTASHCP